MGEKLTWTSDFFSNVSEKENLAEERINGGKQYEPSETGPADIFLSPWPFSARDKYIFDELARRRIERLGKISATFGIKTTLQLRLIDLATLR